jgi:hypothetical protein
MHDRGRIAFSLFLAAVAGYAIYAAWHWPFKTGFFPLAVAIPLLVLALVQLALELFAAAEVRADGIAEAEFTTAASPSEARRRALVTFLWIALFIAFVYLIGFPLAVPLFLILYLRLESKAAWPQSIALTVLTWGAFYALFERLLRLQFAPGELQTWLGV